MVELSTPSTICPAIDRAEEIGIAYPSTCPPVDAAVSMPMISPEAVS